MSTQSSRPRLRVWIALVAVAVFGLPLMVAALQHQPPPPVTRSTVDQPNARVEGQPPEKGEIQEGRQKPSATDARATIPCGETAAEAATGPAETEVLYKLTQLQDNPDQYYGKTITVDGEMHRQFTDRVFTIVPKGWWSIKDVLVISVVPMSESVIPLQDSFKEGKFVRVTGVVRPYERGKLECLFGPLNLESREGKSFTKNPVLIIGYKPPAQPVAAMVPPQPIEREKPAASPEIVEKEEVAELTVTEPEPAPAPAQAPAKPEMVLPKTASNLPLVGLAGLFFLLAACSVRFLASCK